MKQIDIVSAEEAEECLFLVCCRKGTPSPFTDNIEGTCCACAHPVFYRPSSPKKPPRICMQCALERMEATVQ